MYIVIADASIDEFRMMRLFLFYFAMITFDLHYSEKLYES